MKTLLTVIVLMLALTLGACAAETPVSPATETPAAQPADRTFTADELALFNGLGGQPAYVAVDGIVYDVTNNPSWSGGNHRGVQAGQDVSQIIPASHRADMRFENNPIVGTFVD